MINFAFNRDTRSHWEISLRSNIYLVLLFGSAFAVLTLSLGSVAVHFADIKSSVITHFDFYNGATVFGEVSVLYRVFWLAFALIAMNAFLAKTILPREPFFSYILGIGSVLVSVLIFIAMRVIISLN